MIKDGKNFARSNDNNHTGMDERCSTHILCDSNSLHSTQKYGAPELEKVADGSSF